MKTIVKAFIFSLSLFPVVSTAASRSERVLTQLDRDLKSRETYIETKKRNIELIKDSLSRTESEPNRQPFYMKLGDTYASFNNDSCLLYYSKGYDYARSTGNWEDEVKFRVKRAVMLPLSGYINDAWDEFSDIDVSKVPETLLPFYYESGRQLCSYIASFYSGEESKAYWSGLERDFLNKYLSLNPQDDQFFFINEAADLINKGKYAQARGVLEDLISGVDQSSNIFARACYFLAKIAGLTADSDSELYYLAKSSVCDMQSAVLEVTALQELGQIMADKGEIDRAYAYLSAALLNSVECHAAVRMLQTSSVLPFIQQSHSQQISQWRSRIYLIVVLLAVLIAFMIVGLLFLRHQVHRIATLKDRLESANQLKDIYIGQFFRLSSVYIDRMNQLSQIVNRKISAGKVDELYKLTQSNKFVEEQMQDFYKIFDDAFLNIYPTFVSEVNNLLSDKIELKEGQLLNNELRILAFYRLGLEDTTQVAQILNYSVNTIYAYRNRLRNRAFDRKNFDRDVMKIRSV